MLPQYFSLMYNFVRFCCCICYYTVKGQQIPFFWLPLGIILVVLCLCWYTDKTEQPQHLSLAESDSKKSPLAGIWIKKMQILDTMFVQTDFCFPFLLFLQYGYMYRQRISCGLSVPWLRASKKKKNTWRAQFFNLLIYLFLN